MSNFKIILLAISSLILLGIVVTIAAKLIRRKNKAKHIVNMPPVEPNIFEKITLQFSDKISKELEAAKKKIRSVVGNDDNDSKEKEHGMFL